MSNFGARIVRAALSYEGVYEPTGRNDGAQIEAWQRAAEDKYGLARGTYRGAPWCAMFVSAVFDEVGFAHNRMLTHPYTGFIWNHARDNNLFLPSGRTAPPGSLILRNGVHVGIVVHDRGNGLLDTVEGNASDAVRRLVRRRSDWSVVVPPGLGSSPAPVFEWSYGFDDYARKPARYGPWRTPHARNKMLTDFRRKNPLLYVLAIELAQPVRGSRFAFEAGRRRAPGDPLPWQFGGWRTEEIRARQVRSYRQKNPNARIRIWNKRVAVPGPGTAPVAPGTGGPSNNISTT